MDSSRDSKASRGDHLHDFIGGQGIGGEHGALLGLKGNHGVKHIWVCFQNAIDASRAATTGHAGDGQVVRSLAHGEATQPPPIKLVDECRLGGHLEDTPIFGP